MTNKKIILERKNLNYHRIKTSIPQNQLILQKNNYSTDKKLIRNRKLFV